MKLWKRAAGAIKDQNSVMVATLSRRNPYRIPDLESAIIKATSHDESRIDYRNAERVFRWIQTSPVSLKPLLLALTNRMEKTKSWVVAVKGLILIHGVFCCKTPAVQRIGRLPFDLSSFQDGHSKPCKTWGFNAFVRAYFTFLDNRSALLYQQRKQTLEPRVQELSKLQDWQALLDMLLQVKPTANNMKQPLILEAMDGVVIEIFELYFRICNGITKVLMSMYNSGSTGKVEASMAMKVILKAKKQAEDLDLYFRFCQVFGVANAMGVPNLPQVPEEDIPGIQRLINGVSEEDEMGVKDKALILIEGDNLYSNGGLKTVITQKWEVFDEDLKVVGHQGKNQMGNLRTGYVNNSVQGNPFESLPDDYYLPIVPVHTQELPDLITF